MVERWKWDQVDDRPIMVFDYAAQNTGLPLRERLISESQEALAKAGRPQHQFMSDMRHALRSRGEDTKVLTVWKVCNKYVKVLPLSFDDMVALFGDGLARRMIPMMLNWRRLDTLINQLVEDGAAEDFIYCFWGDITDAIEHGEMLWEYYSVLCVYWFYTQRGLTPGEPAPKSKALVPVR